MRWVFGARGAALLLHSSAPAGVCPISASFSPLKQFVVAGVILGSLVPSTARSQTSPDPSSLSIEQLLDVELTSTASKFSQAVTHAPASVTVVTAEEIRHHGYRTLADILSSVRGFYTTYDRNYTYVGVRGFARPGDYNTRVLLLVDGHRLNEPIYDMAPMGTDFPIDVSLIDRVEIIRGPGSSLYGTSAFFAVVNVLTKTAGSSPGTRVDVSVGSQATRRATVSVGRVFENGNEVLVAGSGYDSAGVSRLYFPEFESPGGSDGLAIDADGDRSASVQAQASIGRIRITGALIDRSKRIPTAAFATVFGDPRTRTDDKRAYTDAAYVGPFGGKWTGVARAAVDYYGYSGAYPFDYGVDGIVVSNDYSHSLQVSGELTLNRRGKRHLLTLGTETRRALHNHQEAWDSFGTQLDTSNPSSVFGLYAQDEITLRPWFLLNAGLRLDYQEAFGSSLTPRAGLVFLPRRQSAIKLLYGRAFRAPNSYELHYYGTMQAFELTLNPETIETTEIVWEEYIGAHVRTAVSAFYYDADHLISQRMFEASGLLGGGLYFANDGRSTARGVDAEVEGRWASGLTAAASYSHVRAKDGATEAALSNSPRHLANLRMSAPIKPLASRVGFELRGVGQRQSLDGNAVPGFVVGNVTAIASLNKRLDLEFGVYNVLDARYADPGAEEHVQRAIQQDGRTARVRLIARF
jgi:outer membrane receptor for ferrienterochelin and colicins